MPEEFYWEETPIIASINNGEDPEEVVHILYVPSKNAFLTSGISRLFGKKEIMVPAYMVVKDLELIGAIISVILEDLTQARERNLAFNYGSGFELFGRKYILTERSDCMELGEEREGFFMP